VSREPHDYTIEVCRDCGRQLDREHGAKPSGRCPDPGHAQHAPMTVRVIARPDTEQNSFFRRGRIPSASQSVSGCEDRQVEKRDEMQAKRQKETQDV
jgi:hypothetical protein